MNPETDKATVDEAVASVPIEEGSVVPDYIEVHESELRKVLNAVRQAERFHKSHNEMNAALHLEDVVYSPLTTALSNSVARLEGMLGGYNATLKEKNDANGG